MHVIFQFVTSLGFIFDLKYNRRSINASDSDINIYEYNDYLGINILYSLPVYLDLYTYTDTHILNEFASLSQLPRNLQWRINKISDFRENIFIEHRQHNYIVLAALYSPFFQRWIQIDLYTIFPLNGNRVTLESDVHTRAT